LDEVTAIAGQGPGTVTPTTWKEIMSDCIQGRQEILGVLAGLDPGIPPPVRFPVTEACIGAAIDHLRKAVFAMDGAIASIQTELPERQP